MKASRFPSKMRVAISGVLASLSLLLAAAPHPAGAVTLQIDPAQSQVHYSAKMSFCFPDASGQTVCPPANEIYAISGQVDLEVIPQYLSSGDLDPYRYLLSLTPVGIASDAVASGLKFGTVLGLLNDDGTFATLVGDPFCSVPFPDTFAGCFIMVTFETSGASGTWDGQTLNWTGYQTSFFADFDYTITAVVASVPEPGTLLLTLPALIGLFGRKIPLHRRRPSCPTTGIPSNSPQQA
ncbi:hypothetical protein [Aromatoleum anaerobium]|uniref:PEP-CTERM protein-sorting domain-containing protein n=1 Tax=Aromatoleum anaerobium TaxID=182180 RepID=A0ABX1PQY0_9RHOO|nr:hypothetical protein [Aromatoleum anaerobium]MCK0507351.1 hypothetical protein [Aromatoleum anaerobium]